MRRGLGVAVGLLLAAAAAAGARVDLGWSEGQVAEGAPTVLGPVAAEPIVLPLPADFAKRIVRPTLVVYFSPTCPHCRHVAPELAALAARIADKADVIGVAAGAGGDLDLADFRRSHGWNFPIVRDEDHAIAAALGARGTPSAALVAPDGDRRIALDLWYPYGPGTDALVEMRLAADPWSVFRPDRYLGPRACGACHVQEADAWMLTHHSVAWPTLERLDATTDPSCTGCHVTGAGKPGGWNGDPDSFLVDVGCEACHGASGPHDGQRTEARETCAGCHDPEHSVAFDLSKAVRLIDHFRAAGMDPSAAYAARYALVKGEAPRELLAFPEGAYVGSKACATCHPAEHQAWKRSPHAAAMAKLVDGGAQDTVDCVRCHAMPRRSGPVPTELKGFRVDEGVGCESCHGPGETHVAAGGGKGNIVGLGESCPVCVVEGICTSCHTTAWDPTWDLKADLEKVRHGDVKKSSGPAASPPGLP